MVRGCEGRLLGVTVVLPALLTSAVFRAEPAHADSAVKPTSGGFTIRGADYGHGYAMSQYGGYGVARGGLGR